jgi:DDE_Tnp_1-associated
LWTTWHRTVERFPKRSYFSIISRICQTPANGKVVYPLDEVLLLALLAVLAGAESFVDIARFGCKKLDLLRRFRPFADGTPSHDHLGDIFATLDAEQFQLLRRLGRLADRCAGRRGGDRRQDRAPIRQKGR